MLKRLLPLLVTVGCVASREAPTTWEGRYAKAAERLDPATNELDRFYSLRGAAKASFEVGKIDEASQHAHELLDLASRLPRDWNYGNAIHDGHMVLGRIALKRGDVEAAKAELLFAGKTRGSPQLDTFGPNTSLAKDLLERKETDVVLEHFALCGKFWEMENGNLKRWSILAKAGEVPDFGANLVY